MGFHPVIVLSAFQEVPEGLEFFIAACIEAQILLHGLPFLRQLVMMLVGIHLFREFFRIFALTRWRRVSISRWQEAQPSSSLSISFRYASC